LIELKSKICQLKRSKKEFSTLHLVAVKILLNNGIQVHLIRN